MKYRVTEIEVPEGNPFQFDALKRQPIVEFLRDLIARLEGPFVLALDSPWGTGKTTVVRMLHASLEASDVRCVYFNAWKVDYVSDPLVALVSTIDDLQPADASTQRTFRQHMDKVKKITTAVAKRGVVAAVKAATLGALDVDEALETVAADVAAELTTDLVDNFHKEKASLEAFRFELEKGIALLGTVGNPRTLVFFIDELDRCRPSFAIEMLERIKHLFDVPRIVFVLSIDKSQLEASTAAVYGERINAPEYLRRFIDLEFLLPEAAPKTFTKALVSRFELSEHFVARAQSNEFRADESNLIEAFVAFTGIFGLSLRALERCMARLAIVLDQTPSNNFLDPILIAFLIVVRLKNPRLFGDLTSGKAGSDDAIAVLAQQPGGNDFIRSRLGIILECYLMAGEGDEQRNAKVERLNKVASDAATSTDGIRARDLLGMSKHVPPHMFHRGWFDLKAIASKVDLVTRVSE